MGGVSLHVRTCTPRFCISGMAQPIVFKFGVCVGRWELLPKCFPQGFALARSSPNMAAYWFHTCLIYIPVSWKCRKFWIKTRSIRLEIAFLNFEVQNPKFENLSVPFSTVRYFMSRGIFTFILFLKCVWQLHKLVLFFVDATTHGDVTKSVIWLISQSFRTDLRFLQIISN